MIASQGLLHERYGGVVPEIASRRHLELVDAVTADALERAGARLDDVGAVAVTRGPGLIGALLVGLSSAKALAAARGLPLAPVDHLHGHVVASTLGPSRSSRPTSAWWPAAATPSSRGWTTPSQLRRLGQTLDDAAGEAFDKGARILGLGYPGGPAIDRLAREGDPRRSTSRAPRPRRARLQLQRLKTSLLYRVRDLGEAEAAQRRRSRRLLPARDRRRPGGARRAALERERPRPAGDRRRGGRQLRAARRAWPGWAWTSGCRRSSCAPTTPR